MPQCLLLIEAGLQLLFSIVLILIAFDLCSLTFTLFETFIIFVSLNIEELGLEIVLLLLLLRFRVIYQKY